MLYSHICKSSKLYAVVVSAILPGVVFPISVHAQALEEIIVTAQRREQNLQEVPISLETYSGTILNQQGFRGIEDLTNFSPSVEIDVRTQDQDISIRGMGTTGNNLGLEMATPTFVDGVNFSRTSMIMGAFLDLERVEVLRGPQPIAFGQNATAGAFSLTTRKPGPEWQGDVTTEYGNWGRASIEGGVGGPITDTLGIRLAGQYDRHRGYIRDIVTSQMFPNTEETAGRVTLQWQPSENFETTLKADYSQRRRDGDGYVSCRTEGTPGQFERAVTIPGMTIFDDILTITPYPDCDGKFERVGLREGHNPKFKPIQGIDHYQTNGGLVDISTIPMERNAKAEAHDDMDAYNYRLGMTYQMGSGISIDSNTAYIDYQRGSQFDNARSPIASNMQVRGEIYDMFSQELRVLSDRGSTIEWEAGVFYQYEDLDIGNLGHPKYETSNYRGNTRHPIRTHILWQDAEWMSAFGSFTFNFMDNKASLDMGARYTRVSKQSYAQALAATWIFDIDPDCCDATPGDGIITATQHNDFDVNGNPTNRQRNVTAHVIDCATGHPFCGDYGAGYWTHTWNPPAALRATPDSWDTQAPVGWGAMLFGTRRAPEDEIFYRDYKDSNLDPQVTLRYRPHEDMSLYARWARAFKAGGADISSGALPASQAAFLIEPEHAENFELGAKGSLMDGRVVYGMSLFNLTMTDLQIATAQVQDVRDIVAGGSTGASSSTNAGKQRTRGVEFEGKWAASEQLRLGLSGAFMQGVMVDFTGAGCTTEEFLEADTGPCLSAQESLDLYGTIEFAGTIDRSGYKAPRTPDWKFVVDVDWWGPVGDRHKYTFTSKTSFIDGYINDIEGFSKVIRYPSRVVSNLNIGFGDIDDDWNLTFWVRNLFEAGVKYYPEADDIPTGIAGTALGPRNWRGYGLQFQYNYN